MALTFDPSAYFQAYQRGQQNQQANNQQPQQAAATIGQALADYQTQKRQQALQQLETQIRVNTENRDQQKFASEYGTPIDPNATIPATPNPSQGPGMAMLFSRTSPSTTVQTGSSMPLVDAFNKWRAQGMKPADAQPDFMPALSEKDRLKYQTQFAAPKPSTKLSFTPDQADAIKSRDMSKLGAAFPNGIPQDVMGMVMRPEGYGTGQTSNASWDTASPQEKILAKKLIDGTIKTGDLFRDRAKIVTIAADYANQNNIPFNSYGGDVKMKMAENLASGKLGMNALSLNTAVGHLGSALDAYKDVNNTNQAWLNRPINEVMRRTNDPKIIRLDATLTALRGELANVFKNSAGTDQEIGQWMLTLNSDLTPNQAQAALKQVGELLRSRQSALQYQQQNVMNQGIGDRSLVSPHAQEVLTTLQTPNANASSGTSLSYSDPEKERRYQEWKRSQGGS